MALLSPDELSAVRAVAVSAMVTPCTVYHQTLVETSPQYDYGDDYVAFTGFDTTGSGISLLGNFLNKPTPTAIQSGGQIVTVSGWRAYFPVGSPVYNGDLIVLGSHRFVVADTGEDSTWPASLVCSLKEAEDNAP
jgi:hypothetical protein